MKKDFLLFVVLAFAIFFLVTGIKIESVEEHYLINIDNITEDSETVFLKIDAQTILHQPNLLDPALVASGLLPDDGILLEEKEFVLRPGDTAYDLLRRVTKYYRIPIEYKGFGTSIYVQGIGHLYEYSCGPLSGWMFMINGEFASVDAMSMPLQNQDRIAWMYTCDLGRDIGWGDGS